VKNAGLWKVDVKKRYQTASTLMNLSTVKKRLLAAQTVGRLESQVMMATTALAGPNAMIVFGFQGVSKYRYAQLTKGELRLGQVGSFGGNGTKVYAKKPGVALVGKMYRLQLDTYADGWVKVYLEGRLKLSYKFKKPMPGVAGVGAVKANAFFDNFKVLDATVLP